MSKPRTVHAARVTTRAKAASAASETDIPVCPNLLNKQTGMSVSPSKKHRTQPYAHPTHRPPDLRLGGNGPRRKIRRRGPLLPLRHDQNLPAFSGDDLYDQAVAIVTESRRASISGVQRRLKVGYNRAARMIEEMEASGVVSEVQSNGQREVIAPRPRKD